MSTVEPATPLSSPAPAAATPGQAAIEAAARAIMTAQNANDDEPERWEATLLARVALETGVPLLTAQAARYKNERDEAREKLTAADRAAAMLNAENDRLAAERNRLREECNALATSHGKLHEALTAIATSDGTCGAKARAALGDGH